MSVISTADSVAAQTDAATVTPDDMYWDLDTSVFLIYDRFSPVMKNNAEQLYDVIHSWYPNIHKLPIATSQQLVDVMESGDENDIYIHFFDTRFDKVIIGFDEANWQEFAAIIRISTDSYNILSMANTKQFHENGGFRLTNVVYDPTVEFGDAELIYFSTFWYLSEALETREGHDYTEFAMFMKQAAIQFFSDNFNQILERQMQPVTPIGQENPDAEAKVKEAADEAPKSIKRSIIHINEDGSETVYEYPEVTDVSAVSKMPGQKVAPLPGQAEFYQMAGVPQPVIDFAPEGAGEYTIGQTPNKSGMTGAIGGIMDVLMALVNTFGGDMTLSGDAVDNIVSMISLLKTVIGVFSDGASGEGLEAVIEILKSEFPAAREALKYFDLFMEGMKVLRDPNFANILAFAEDLLTLLLPDESSEIMSIVSKVMEYMEQAMDFVDRIANHPNTMVLIASEIMKALIGLLGEQIAKLLGLDPDVPAEKTKMENFAKLVSSIIQIGMEFLMGGDWKVAVQQLLPPILQLVNTLVGGFTPMIGYARFPNDVAYDKIGDIVSTVFGLVSLLDTKEIKNNLQGTLTQLVETLLESTFGISISGIKDTIDDIGKKVADFLDNPTQAWSTFKSALIAQIGQLTGDSQIQSIIEQIVMIGINIARGEFSIPDASQYNIAALLPVVGAYLGFSSADIEGLQSVVNGALGVIASITNVDSLIKAFMGTKDALWNPSNLVSTFLGGSVTSPSIKYILDLVGWLDTTLGLGFNIGSHAETIKSFVDIFRGFVSLVTEFKEKPIMAILQSIPMLAGGVLFATDIFPDDLPVEQIISLIQAFNPQMFQNILETGLDGAVQNLLGDDCAGALQRTATEAIHSIAEGLFGAGSTLDAIDFIVEALFTASSAFTGGFKYLLGKAIEWIGGEVDKYVSQWLQDLNTWLADDLLCIESSFSIGFGTFGAITIDFGIKITPNFDIDITGLITWIKDIIMDGAGDFDLSIGNLFVKLLSFLEIIPVFKGWIEAKGLDSSKNAMLATVCASLGVDIAFTGGASLEIQLFALTAGSIRPDSVMKIIGWSFNVKLTISRTFTVLDFITGGTAGALNKVGKYIGLDAITITVYIGIGFEIIYRVATASAPAVDRFSITLTIGATLHIGLDLVIVGISLDITFEITITFMQDKLADTPLQIIFDLMIKVSVTLKFLFIEKDFGVTWRPNGFPLTYPGNEEGDNQVGGDDTDDDGIPDALELEMPGMDINKPDTDDDGLTDKEEIEVYRTDPGKFDSDGDGLSDGEEIHTTKTNPLEKDTDFEGINDGDEVLKYGTDPNCPDTDNDGLTDEFEIKVDWDMSRVTPTVSQIMIGGEPFDSRTDPLNPDTDGDGLLDGQEGEFGKDWCQNIDSSEPHLIFNFGYTHPLDADTDDDSYLQLWNGTLATAFEGHVFLMDMSDKVEIDGIEAIIIQYDEPVRMTFYTNPVCPDSDDDSIEVLEYGDPIDYWNEYILGDGYELASDPATNPLNGDTDGDGLKDSLEGASSSFSNHTNPVNADTDGDGLPDGFDVNPRKADADGDGIFDALELELGTDPLNWDTDFDSISDYDEVYIYHTSPFMRDSDGDHISDTIEILYLETSPINDDTDNDFLSDSTEYWDTGTDPLDPDTDDDGLTDYEEVTFWNTNPHMYDTDGDSITDDNGNGEWTFDAGDGQEALVWGTDPTVADCDTDGINDGWELYLRLGDIPNFDNIALDPWNNDTDGDGLLDGQELIVANISDLTFPFRSFTAMRPFNSSPVLADTDGDGLTDAFEVRNTSTMPDVPDTDNDTLSDGYEYNIVGTSPLLNDTDGDHLNDSFELDYNSGGNATHPGLDPLDGDTDNDWLPDGAEVMIYGSDPTLKDENTNGIPDGFELDSDHDGLLDGYEYYHPVWNTSQTENGPFSPDADKDGLLDGHEAFYLGTLPGVWDTDNDTYGDGLEVFLGSPMDPLVWNSEDDFLEAAGKFALPYVVISPIDNSAYGPPVVIHVENVTEMENVTYRYREQGETSWGDNSSLPYDDATGRWHEELELADGEYEMQFIGLHGGIEYVYELGFEVDSVFPGGTLGMIGAGVAGAGLLGVGAWLLISRRAAAAAAGGA